MDIESTCGTSGDDSLVIAESGVTSDALAKLRRLKIQESIVAASLEKSKTNFDLNGHTIVDSNYSLDWKKYSNKVKNDISDIKNMFEDIKVCTEDNLKNINIEEIKRDILNLNGKIKSLEDYIDTELKSLKSEEDEILKQMNEEPKRVFTMKRYVKTHSKQYNEVVPSPVKVLINSPLKCNEVQQFQAFMSKSKNRYGGWNEYNHNTFVQIWNKFYATDDIVNLENTMKKVCHTIDKLLPQFKDEIYEKIPGIQLDDIISHSKWFSEYLYLKKAQQIALDNWRDNKRKIKGREGKVKNDKIFLHKSSNEKLCRTQNETKKYQNTIFNVSGSLQNHDFEPNQKVFEANNKSDNSLQLTVELNDVAQKDFNESYTETHKKNVLKVKSKTFATPTEQWSNRCNDKNALKARRHIDSFIENVDKLCIPDWRLNLNKH